MWSAHIKYVWSHIRTIGEHVDGERLVCIEKRPFAASSILHIGFKPRLAFLFSHPRYFYHFFLFSLSLMRSILS
jgi:hypothetical protein